MVYSQVLIFSHHHNRDDFIKIQYDTFKKFLTDDYEFIVFNDGPNDIMCNKIDTTCAELNIRCIRIPQKIHTYPYLYRLPRETMNHPCVRCANVMQYSLNELGIKHDDIVAIIDSDMFLTKEFSIRKYLEGFDLAGVKQQRPNSVEYIWNGLVFFDMKTLPNKQLINFNCGEVNNTPVDVGGQMHHYFKQTPQVRCRFITQGYVAQYAPKSVEELHRLLFNEPMIQFIKANPHVVELYADNSFVHYRSGTNWDRKSPSYHANKTEILQTLITSILQN